MRKAAMNQNRRIVEVAESLILSAGLLGGGREED
jgi:AmiR/NasT family two-component response regulator